MAVDLRLPNINGTTEREQIAQMQSYLYQLVEQLMWALSDDKGDASAASQEVSTTDIPSIAAIVEDSFEDIKQLIIKDADILEAYFQEIDRRLRDTGYYAEHKDLEALEQAISDDQTDIENLQTDMDAVKKSVAGLGTYHTVQPYDGLDFDTLIEITSSYAGEVEPESVGCVNSPTNKPGFLEVTALTGSAYHTYRTVDGEVYTRSYSTANGWSGWAMHTGVTTV